MCIPKQSPHPTPDLLPHSNSQPTAAKNKSVSGQFVQLHPNCSEILQKNELREYIIAGMVGSKLPVIVKSILTDVCYFLFPDCLQHLFMTCFNFTLTCILLTLKLIL